LRGVALVAVADVVCGRVKEPVALRAFAREPEIRERRTVAQVLIALKARRI